MIKSSFLLLLLCATAHAGNVPSRLSQDYSETLDGRLCLAEIEELPETFRRLFCLDEVKKSSDTDMLGRLNPNESGEPSKMFGRLFCPGVEPSEIATICKNLKVDWTQEELETIESTKKDFLILSKFKDHDDIGKMNELLEPILTRMQVGDQRAIRWAINGPYTTHIYRTEKYERIDEELILSLKGYFRNAPIDQIDQAVEEARTRINQEVGEEVYRYVDEDAMDAEINILFCKQTEEERSRIEPYLESTYQRDGFYAPIDPLQRVEWIAVRSSSEVRYADTIEEIVVDARKKVKEAKARLGATQLENYDVDEKMTEMLESLFEKKRMSNSEVEQVVQEARWKVTLRNAVRQKMKSMVQILLHFGEKYQKTQLGSPVRLAVEVDDKDILKMLLEFTGSTKDFESALELAFHYKMRKFNSVACLLDDERLTSAKARALLVKGVKDAVYEKQFAVADLILKSGRLDEPEYTEMLTLYNHGIQSLNSPQPAA